MPEMPKFHITRARSSYIFHEIDGGGIPADALAANVVQQLLRCHECHVEIPNGTKVAAVFHEVTGDRATYYQRCPKCLCPECLGAGYLDGFGGRKVECGCARA